MEVRSIPTQQKRIYPLFALTWKTCAKRRNRVRQELAVNAASSPNAAERLPGSPYASTARSKCCGSFRVVRDGGGLIQPSRFSRAGEAFMLMYF
jgi:hypothetical protein